MAQQFTVGEIDVIAVSDGTITIPALAYFGKTLAEWEPHKALLDAGNNLQSPIGCFVIRSGERTILIDAGLGKISAPGYEGGSLLDDLASAGVRPGDIDTVFCTHLHADHIGWGRDAVTAARSNRRSRTRPIAGRRMSRRTGRKTCRRRRSRGRTSSPPWRRGSRPPTPACRWRPGSM